MLEYVTNHSGKLSDKWAPYYYTYHQKLNHLRTSNVSLIEIGVQNGGSLEIWEKYFPNSKLIIGIDIDPRVKQLRFESSKIHILIQDASSFQVLDEVNPFGSQFDVIIDDGSHISSDIIKTFAIFWPLISPGGIYFIEDLHCAYWKEYRSGFRAKNSAIEFFKNLVDIVNFESIGVRRSKLGIFEPGSLAAGFFNDFSELFKIERVEFMNSMVCITKKKEPTPLFTRIVSGEMGLVTPEHKNLHNTDLIAYDQQYNPYARYHRWKIEFPISKISFYSAKFSIDFKSIVKRVSNKFRSLNTYG